MKSEKNDMIRTFCDKHMTSNNVHHPSKPLFSPLAQWTCKFWGQHILVFHWLKVPSPTLLIYPHTAVMLPQTCAVWATDFKCEGCCSPFEAFRPLICNTITPIALWERLIIICRSAARGMNLSHLITVEVRAKMRDVRFRNIMPNVLCKCNTYFGVQEPQFSMQNAVFAT